MYWTVSFIQINLGFSRLGPIILFDSTHDIPSPSEQRQIGWTSMKWNTLLWINWAGCRGDRGCKHKSFWNSQLRYQTSSRMQFSTVFEEGGFYSEDDVPSVSYYLVYLSITKALKPDGGKVTLHFPVWRPRMDIVWLDHIQ